MGYEWLKETQTQKLLKWTWEENKKITLVWEEPREGTFEDYNRKWRERKGEYQGLCVFFVSWRFISLGLSRAVDSAHTLFLIFCDY